MELSGRVAVVTGAASGLGRSLALQLAQAGCSLALVDIQAQALREVAADCRGHGAQVSTHAVDVADRAALSALPATVVGFHGQVHILINNAGVTVADTVLEQSMEDWDWIMGINFWGVVVGTRAFLPHLLAADEAHIVNVSSIFGLAGVPMQAAYCATKFAVRGFTESLGAELASTRVRVSSVHPGGINTNIVGASRMRDETARGRVSILFDRLALSPDVAAAIIIRGIRRRQSRILIGWEAYLLTTARRVAPTLSMSLLGAIGRAFGVGKNLQVYTEAAERS